MDRRLRRAEFDTRAAAAGLQVEIRREVDRARKRGRPLGPRLSRRVWIMAGTVSSLEPTSSTVPRLFVYWHVKRYLARGLLGIASEMDAGSVDAEIADARYGRCAAEVLDAVADVDGAVHFGAARWIAELRVFEWLVGCNLHGASPSSTDLFSRFQSYFPAGSGGDRYAAFLHGAVSENGGLKNWARTFRRRWQVEFRQLPKGNELTDAELSQKVAPLFSARHCASRLRAARLCHCFVGSLVRVSCSLRLLVRAWLPALRFRCARRCWRVHGGGSTVCAPRHGADGRFVLAISCCVAPVSRFVLRTVTVSLLAFRTTARSHVLACRR